MEALQRAAYALAEEVYKDASARAQAESRADKDDRDGARQGQRADANGARQGRDAGKAREGLRADPQGGDDGPPDGAEDVDYEVVE